jgi:tetratricopeptide (TPR) repeat protein
MDLGEREQLLRGIADGDVALRDVGGLSPQDVFAIARVGAAAMQGGRYTQAASVFSALIALEPRETTHRLHLALAHQGEGDVDAALAALDALLGLAGDREADPDLDPDLDDDLADDLARAWLLRAELLGRTDRHAALAALAAARALTSPAAVAVVDAALGRR